MIIYEIKLEENNLYCLNEILSLSMKQIDSFTIKYLVFEKDSKVYFFENVEHKKLRLVCITNKYSFHLS